MKIGPRRTILILLIATIAASGCTQNDTSVETTQEQGVQIIRFSAFPQSIFGGSAVQLQAGVKNTGGAVAQNVNLQLFNLPDEWQGSDQSIDFGTLNPPEPDSSIPAVPQEQTVSLTAPEIGNSVKIPYDIMGRLTYEYQTVGVSEVTLMSFERFRQTEGQRTQTSVDNTGGPIQLDIRTRTPIVFYSGDSSATRLCVIVRNVGPGRPYLPSKGVNEGVNKVELSAESSGEFSLQQTDSGAVQMVDGRGVQCYEFQGLNEGDANIQTTVPVRITANYGYMKEASSQVTVTGKP